MMEVPAGALAGLLEAALGLLPDLGGEETCARNVAGGILSAHKPSLGEWFGDSFHSGEGRLFQLRKFPAAPNRFFQLLKKIALTARKLKRLHQRTLLDR